MADAFLLARIVSLPNFQDFPGSADHLVELVVFAEASLSHASSLADALHTKDTMYSLLKKRIGEHASSSSNTTQDALSFRLVVRASRTVHMRSVWQIHFLFPIVLISLTKDETS